MPNPNHINPKTGKRYGWEEEQRRRKGEDVKAINQHIALLERQKMALEARERFMTFIKFTSPDPEDPNDVHRSKYKNAKHHDALARVLEEVEKGSIPFLVLTMPPRHGKSEQVSRRFPAWFIGRHPEQNVVVATYNDDFASDFGKDVRSIIASSQFKLAFPGVKLQRGGGASDRLQTTQGGQMSFVGRGGSLTGRGAHCFVSGTSVITTDGSRQIQMLSVGDEVLSYENGLQWRRVQALSRREGARIFRITTAAGRVVEATGDHPFYVDGRWVEARQLAAGDRLMCALRQDRNAPGARCPKAFAEGSYRLLLLKRMLGEIAKYPKVRRTVVRALRYAGTTAVKCRHAGGRQDILFRSVPASGETGRVRNASAGADEVLRTVQRNVPSFKQLSEILFEGLRIAASCGRDGRPGEPALEGWGFGQSREAARHQTLSRDATACHETGRQSLRSLFDNDQETGSPSHRREPTEQQIGESRDALPSMPYARALFRREDDFVRSVEDTGRTADVYDIQVEGTHCFFANEVLVHNCLICDDLIKDDKEAQSKAIRDQAWSWFTKVAMSRRMGKKLVIMTFTRWHADDPIGRLTDPENPHYNRKLAEKIKIINLPAIAEEDDPLGRAPGEPLWPDGPDRFDLEFLEEQQSLDPLGFAALYQQRPSLLDGDLFKRENIRFYKKDELPEDLRFYAASDHAVGTGQRNDPSCLLKVAIDRQSNIYLTECVWKKMKTDMAVEAMLVMAGGKNRPLLWWAERGHISKSIGPFLRKRMLETGTYINIREVTPATDKEQRAQSIAARVAMGKVFFPEGELWVEKAINEMMAFPNGVHDDFVDTLAYIGLGLQSQFAPANSSAKKKADKPAFGTLAWVKLADKWAAEQRALKSAGGF